MHKTILFLLIVFILSPFSFVGADGGLVPYYEYEFKDIYEPSQTSLIVYDEGQEDLYLKVNYEGETNKFVWLVPTPHYPEASKAPKDLFEELSALTVESHSWTGKVIPEGEGFSDSLGQNVIVHEQKQVGIYEVTVLSATGVNGLFDWLNDNNYKVNEEAKDLLDWYVKKEWYFTAMRIDEDSEDINPTAVYKYSDYIEPIKISFSSQIPVYPLKISQISTRVPEDTAESLKTNEVLLYVLSDGQVNAPGFTTEYAQSVDLEKLEQKEQELYSEDLESLKQIIDKEYFLTKLRRDFARVEMDDDLYFISSDQGLVGDNQLDIYFFWGENCPHCEKEKVFLSKLESSYPNLTVHSFEIYHNDENASIFNKAKNILSIDITGVPLLVIGNKHFLGYASDETTGEEIKDRVDFCLNFTCTDVLKEVAMPLVPLLQSYGEDENYQQAKDRVHGSALSDRLKGKIVLKVEENGEAYYINPITKLKRYLGRPADAFSVMREQGIGITNANLAKIPVGLDNLSGFDTDKDGLPDMFEDAVGTDKNKTDTDGDGHSDNAEIESGYNPSGFGKLNLDSNFASNQKGKIFLQVENHGEAWYVNPKDGKRYFLGRPTDAFNVMQNLGLGISNSDFEQL